MKKVLDVLLVTMTADSSDSGYAARVLLMAKMLKKAGKKVGVVRFIPAFHAAPSWRNDLSKEGCDEVIEKKILPISRYAIFRWLMTWYANIYLFLLYRRMDIHCVQAEAHEAANAVLALIRPKCKVIVDFHGAASAEAEYSRRRVNKSFKSMCNWLDLAECLALKYADTMFVVSPVMQTYLESKHNIYCADNFFNFPVGVSEDFINFNADKHVQRKKIDIDVEDFVFVYCGGVQDYQCIPETAELISKLSLYIPNCVWLIITHDTKSFSEKIKHADLSRLKKVILKSAAKNEVPALLSVADFGFVLRGNEILNAVSCPTKVGEYLFLGVGLISSPYSGHAPILIKEEEVGVIVDFDTEYDAKALAFKLHQKKTDDFVRKCMNVAQKRLGLQSIQTKFEDKY